jgi:hypothetical protein
MADWRRKLTHPLTVPGGPTLRTLADAAYVLDLPAEVQGYNAWQSTARKMLAPAERGHIEAVTKQLELALLIGGKLKL